MLERILHFSINNRWLILLLVIIAAGVGAYSLIDLPIDSVAPAFSPLEMEKRVTLPLEFALSGIPGLKYTSSFSRNGLSQITCFFEDDVDIYFARTQVTERLSEAKETLPAGVEPKMGDFTTALGEVYMWTLDFAHSAGKAGRRTAPTSRRSWKNLRTISSA
jgi:cobalt-zinc-cadmium resistance protein CzcA